MDGWTDFYVAEVGAAAALAGLLVVAVSINITRILEYPNLPGHAAQTLMTVGTALILASLALFPGQPPVWFGLEAIAGALFIAVTGAQRAWLGLARKAPGDPLFWTISRIGTVATSSLPLLIGGIVLAVGQSVGLYWIGVGVIVILVVTLQRGWVLLVEILR
jgi:modulator of FtsH protease